MPSEIQSRATNERRGSGDPPSRHFDSTRPWADSHGRQLPDGSTSSLRCGANDGQALEQLRRSITRPALDRPRAALRCAHLHVAE